MTHHKTGEFYLGIVDRISGKPWIPSGFMLDLLKTFTEFSTANEQSRKALVGGIFELGLAECLIMEGIGPFYFKARLESVPIHSYDLLLYHRTAPVAISAKVSTAERWKQAAYEGLALESKFPESKQYLITAGRESDPKISQHISNGCAPGLYGYIDARNSAWDKLLSKLAHRKIDSSLGFHIAGNGIKSRFGPLGPS